MTLSSNETKTAETSSGAAPAAGSTNNSEVITLGAGCFWCTEAVFQQIPGVISVMPGYMGGTVKNPTYEQICTGETGHAEVAEITFDPARDFKLFRRRKSQKL